MFNTIVKVQTEDFKSKILDMLQQSEYSKNIRVGLLSGEKLANIKTVKTKTLEAVNIEKFIRVSKSLASQIDLDVVAQLKSFVVKDMEAHLFAGIIENATGAVIDLDTLCTKVTDDEYVLVVPYGTAIQLDAFGKYHGIPTYFANTPKPVVFKPVHTYFAVSDMSYIRHLPVDGLLDHTESYQLYADYIIGTFDNCYTIA